MFYKPGNNIMYYEPGNNMLVGVQAAATGSSKYSVSVNNEFAGDFWNNFKTRVSFVYS